jgi:ribonuclease inhibitor
MDYLLIDGDRFKNITELHQFLQENLDFPDFYGMNADALWDMLTGWVGFPLNIEWINYDGSLKYMGHDSEILLGIFRSAEKELKQEGFKFILKYRQECVAITKRRKLIIDGLNFDNSSELYNYIVNELGLDGRPWVNSDRLWQALSKKYDLSVTIEWRNFEKSREKLGKDAEEILNVLNEMQVLLKSFKVDVK